MKERERVIATGLTILTLILWLGFLVHRSPRFAGSPWGGVLGVSGAGLMLVPLAYLIIKRVRRVRTWVLGHTSMRTLLAWHIYAGIVGPILVLLHSGHKFESPQGIVLTGLTLVVVFSGFIGRYMLKQFSTEIREKQNTLAKLQGVYQHALGELAQDPQRARALRPLSGFLSRLLASLFVGDVVTETTGASPGAVYRPATLLRLAESISDLEYAIKTHEIFKSGFRKWLKFHIVISLILYVMLGLHVWASIHFGLRWFETPGAPAAAISHAVDDSPRTSVNKQVDAVDVFSRFFGELFKDYWRSTATIHGIRTTVFDYAALAAEVGRPRSNFTRAVQALERVDLARLKGGDRAKAFWINVYNFAAMKLAAENYPLASILDPKISADDPWGVPAVQVGGRFYTLKEIENEVLLKQFGDPRIVLAISCAAVSCPDRGSEIFLAASLDQQLDTLIRNLFANPAKGLKLDPERAVLTLSWILQADQRLFKTESGEDGVLEFVRRYASPQTRDWIQARRADLKIRYFKHDWALNDVALADKNTDATAP